MKQAEALHHILLSLICILKRSEQEHWASIQWAPLASERHSPGLRGGVLCEGVRGGVRGGVLGGDAQLVVGARGGDGDECLKKFNAG